LINSNVFYFEEKTFNYGTMVPSKYPDGVTEKFKIINANKIPCTVNFKVSNRAKSLNEPCVFSVKPDSKHIMPHEHMYVECNFKPTIMA
jgi:hypothetical protein